MATYYSDKAKKKNRFRPLYSAELQTIQARTDIPNGTVLSIGDIILGPVVGENQYITSVDTLLVGTCTSLAGEVGHFQVLDNSGNPVVVQRKGPLGPSSDNFTSPSTSAAAYASAGALAGYVVTAQSAPVATTGPSYIGVQITTGGTASTDCQFYIGVTLVGEVVPTDLTGTQAPSGTVNNYLL